MLLAHPVWLYSSGPIGDPPKPQEAPVEVDELFECTAPREHKVFAGKLERRHLPLREKAMTSLVRGPEGDFRDWDAVRQWAGCIAGELTAQRS